MKLTLRLLVILLFPAAISAQEQFSVYFESNKHEPKAAESARIEKWIAENPEVKVVAINGYTDEDGTTGFNDTLAQRRVNFIFKSISGKVKIREDFKTRSFGELHKMSETKSENRKVTIYYLLPKDLSREDEILGIKKEVAAKPKPEKKYPEKLSFTNPDGTKSEFKLDVEFMKQVDQAKAGEKLKLENLNFRINTFAVLPESRGKMYELLIVLQNNPDLKIDIQGHLCCMPVDRLDLSTQRAKAIWNFLVSKEIEKSRLSYKGFGSSQPIYPLPEKNEGERAANRRVEIYIVEN